jgi:hypothetical protein
MSNRLQSVLWLLLRVSLLAVIACSPGEFESLRVWRLSRQAGDSFSQEHVAAAWELARHQVGDFASELPTVDLEVLSPTRLEFIYSESPERKLLHRWRYGYDPLCEIRVGVDCASGEWVVVTESYICPQL